MSPRVENAPGIVWRKLKSGWLARWQARSDLVKSGYRPSSVWLWSGPDPAELDQAFISQECTRLQDEMLIWGRGGLPVVTIFDGTMSSLVHCYKHDPESNYQRIRFTSRQHYDTLCRYLIRDHGQDRLEEITGRTLRHWYRAWSEGGRVTMAHSMVGMLRTLATFGSTLLDDLQCQRIKGLLHDLKFSMGKPRTERLTSEQADMIRAKAHEMGRPSLALAQALQFEAMLRQKDVIGEWVPISETGISDVHKGNEKWLRGLRWEEIDENLILRHITSKRQKAIELDLKLMPMVMEELATLPHKGRVGPVIVCEWGSLPWTNAEFRRWWRMVARACGIPDAVRNMDSRAGAITEATEAGADLEAIKHAATHSDISMTQRYARGEVEKTAGVMRKRVEYRNKNKAE